MTNQSRRFIWLGGLKKSYSGLITDFGDIQIWFFLAQAQHRYIRKNPSVRPPSSPSLGFGGAGQPSPVCGIRRKENNFFRIIFMRNPESGFTPERKKGLALALGILIGAGVAIDKCVDKLTDPGSVEPAKKEVRLTPEEVKSLRKGLDTALRVLGSLKESDSVDEKLPEIPRFDKFKITKDFLASFPNRGWLSELSETEAVHDLLHEELSTKSKKAILYKLGKDLE